MACSSCIGGRYLTQGNSNNTCKRLGISNARPIGSAEVDRLWAKYDSRHTGSINREVAAKFLKDFSAAIGAEAPKEADVLREVMGDSTTLDKAAFLQLISSAADGTLAWPTRHAMHSLDRSLSTASCLCQVMRR